MFSDEFWNICFRTTHSANEWQRWKNRPFFSPADALHVIHTILGAMYEALRVTLSKDVVIVYSRKERQRGQIRNQSTFAKIPKADLEIVIRCKNLKNLFCAVIVGWLSYTTPSKGCISKDPVLSCNKFISSSNLAVHFSKAWDPSPVIVSLCCICK
jgi:hypothetical protein